MKIEGRVFGEALTISGLLTKEKGGKKKGGVETGFMTKKEEKRGGENTRSVSCFIYRVSSEEKKNGHITRQKGGYGSCGRRGTGKRRGNLIVYATENLLRNAHIYKAPPEEEKYRKKEGKRNSLFLFFLEKKGRGGRKRRRAGHSLSYLWKLVIGLASGGAPFSYILLASGRKGNVTCIRFVTGKGNPMRVIPEEKEWTMTIKGSLGGGKRVLIVASTGGGGERKKGGKRFLRSIAPMETLLFWHTHAPSIR